MFEPRITSILSFSCALDGSNSNINKTITRILKKTTLKPIKTTLKTIKTTTCRAAKVRDCIHIAATAAKGHSQEQQQPGHCVPHC